MFKPGSATAVSPRSALAEGKKNLFQPRVYFFAYLIVFNALRGGLVSMSLEENINLNTKTIQLKFDCYFVTSQ